MRQDLQAVQSALQSGDMDKAQEAFAAFKDDFHATHYGHALYQSHVPAAIQDDLRGLQSALKSGDLQAAQQAFATFQQDMAHRIYHNQPPEPPLVEPPQSTATVSSQGVNVIA
jgi:ribosomal protein S20